MKVLFIDHFNEPEPGGGQYYILRAARALEAHGHDVVLVALKDSCVAKLFKENGLKVVEADFFSKNIAAGTARIYRLISKLKPDAVVCQSFYETLSSFLSSFVFSGVKFIRIFHTEPFPFFAESAFRKISLHLRTLIETKIFKHLRFIAVSEYVYKELVNSNVAPSRIETVRPFLNAEEILENSRMKAPAILNREDVVIASCGRLVRSKNFETLISAVEKLVKDGLKVKTVIFGKGPEEKNLKKLVAEKNLHKVVEFAGHKVYWWKEPFDVYVTASLSESFSISLFTAAAAGFPCIASDIPAHREILGDNYRFLFKPYDALELSSILKYVMDNKDEAVYLAHAIKDRLERVIESENFDSKFVDALVKLCKAD